MLNKLIISMDARDWLCLVAVSFVVAFCGVFGASYVMGEGYPVFKLWAECLLTVLFTMFTMILLIVLNAAFDAGLAKAQSHREADAAGEQVLEEAVAPGANTPPKPPSRLARFTPAWNLRSIIAFSAIMAVFWLPWYIANFPGGTYWDTYYQMFQVYPENHPIAIIPWAEIYDRTLTDAWLVDHHPVFTTLVYGLFGWGSDQLTGNWMAGVAIFCALQGLAHIVAFTASVAYMRKVGCPPILNLVSYAFFALMPFISTWAMCMVKDSFFGLFFVPYFMMLFECVHTCGAMMARPRNRVLFVLLALGLCLTKKTGIFVVVFTAVVAIIVYALKSNRCIAAIRAFVVQALTCFVVICLVLPYIAFPLLNIEPGGKQETLGPLFQQTARYVHDYGDEVTPQEREAIGKVIDYSKLSSEYAFDFEDSVKYRYNLDATPEDLAAYFDVYIQQGLKHPDAYFGAIMALAGFYVAPTAFVNIRMVTVDTKMGDDQRYMLWNPDELDPLRMALDEAYETIGSTPGIDLPLLIVTYLLWVPAFLIYMLRRHGVRNGRRPTAPDGAPHAAPDGTSHVAPLAARLHAGLLMAPMLVLFAFCVIAPVYDGRYVVPTLDTVPLLFDAVFVCIMETLPKKHTNIAI